MFSRYFDLHKVINSNLSRTKFHAFSEINLDAVLKTPECPNMIYIDVWATILFKIYFFVRISLRKSTGKAFESPLLLYYISNICTTYNQDIMKMIIIR